MISPVQIAGSTWRSRTRCVCRCGSALGFSLDERALLIIATGQGSEQWRARRRADQIRAPIFMLLDVPAVEVNPGAGAVGELCTSCALTRARPNDADTAALAAFAAAEKAKRRLVAELIDLKLPIVGRDQDPDGGHLSIYLRHLARRSPCSSSTTRLICRRWTRLHRSSCDSVVTHVRDRLEESETLQQQAQNNSLSQFSASPDLHEEFTAAVIGAMDSSADLSAQILAQQPRPVAETAR